MLEGGPAQCSVSRSLGILCDVMTNSMLSCIEKDAYVHYFFFLILSTQWPWWVRAMGCQCPISIVSRECIKTSGLFRQWPGIKGSKSLFVLLIISLSKPMGKAPGWCQAIICTSVGILSIGTLGTNASGILSTIHTSSFKKMHLKMLSGKWWPSYLGPNVLMNSQHTACTAEQ